VPQRTLLVRYLRDVRAAPTGSGEDSLMAMIRANQAARASGGGLLAQLEAKYGESVSKKSSRGLGRKSSNLDASEDLSEGDDNDGPDMEAEPDTSGQRKTRAGVAAGRPTAKAKGARR
jgi:hypothetical protein